MVKYITWLNIYRSNKMYDRHKFNPFTGCQLQIFKRVFHLREIYPIKFN